MNKIKDQIVSNFLDFAVEANSRSTVDIRDGLKPVHRRVLYTLSNAKAGFIGSPKIIGEVLGNYHPHGDTSVYNAAVRLSQDFKTRYPLIEIHGNTGSLSEPMRFAAMRYTKMKLSSLGQDVLTDIKKETVSFSETYDGEMMEPDFLPGLVPVTLMNGTVGIGVGMATSIPPHNLREIANAVSHLIDNPEATTKDLMRYIKGPDFPTGGTIINPEALLNAYETGGGSAKIKADYEVLTKNGQTHIIIKEVPFLVNPETGIIQPLQELYANGYEHIEDIQNDTGDDADFQLDITLAKGAPVHSVIETLIKETSIESSFTINLTARVGDNKFQKQNLKSILAGYISQNQSRNVKAVQFDVDKAEARKLIVQGLIKATASIEEVIKTIKASANTAQANENLRKLLVINELQAKAILSMRLSQLTKLDADKLKNELLELNAKLAELNDFLGDENAQLEKIRYDILELSKKYGDARRTKIKSELDVGEIEDITIFLTDEDEIYAQPTDVLAENRRNTKGKKGENIISVIEAKSNGTILMASTDGMVYPVEVAAMTISDDIVKVGVHNFGPTAKVVQLLIPTRKDNLITITEKNIVKRSSLSDYNTNGSFRVCKVREDDKLSQVFLLNDDERIIMLLDNGKYVAFDMEEVRSTGVNTIGTKLSSYNVVSVVPEDEFIIFLDAESNGKKILKGDIKTSGRKTNGLTCNDATGLASGSKDSHVYIFGEDGKMIRLPMRSVSKTAATTSRGTILYNGNIGKILTR